MTPSLAVLAAAALSGLAAILCEGEPRRLAFSVLKPLTTALLMLLATLSATASDPAYRLRVLIAMLLCLFGDIALTGRTDKAFAAGLGAFLLAHLVLIAAFARGLSLAAMPGWAWIAVPYALAAWLLLWPRAASLRIPVMLYVLALLAVWVAAATRLSALGGLSARAALAGATLFVLSDSLLAWQRFVGAYRFADALVLASYWTAMSLLALSVAGSGVV